MNDAKNIPNVSDAVGKKGSATAGKESTEPPKTYKEYRDKISKLIELGHFQEAEGIIKSAIEAKSNESFHLSLLNLLGYLYYNWEKYWEAIEQYDKVIGDIEELCKKKEGKQSEERGYALIYRGLALYRKGDLKEAERSFNCADGIIESFELKSRSEGDNSSLSLYKLARAAIRNNLARIFIDEGKYSDAEAEISAALDVYKDIEDSKYFEQLQPEERKTQGDVKTALLINSGILHYEQDENDKARDEFSKAIAHSKKIGTRSYRAQYNLANTYAKEGKTETAKDLYNMALEINPKMKEAKDALKGLKNGKDKVDWWEWWFKPVTSEYRIPRAKGDKMVPLPTGKSIVAIVLILSLATLLIYGAVWPMLSPNALNATNAKYTTQIVTKANNTQQAQGNQQNTTKTTEINPIGMDTRLLWAALILVILLHPIIKSFSAKEGKIEFESASKGSAPSPPSA